MTAVLKAGNLGPFSPALSPSASTVVVCSQFSPQSPLDKSWVPFSGRTHLLRPLELDRDWSRFHFLRLSAN